MNVYEIHNNLWNQKAATLRLHMLSAELQVIKYGQTQGVAIGQYFDF
jgi:hypothetical protein